jgi:hypothetical protein
LSDKNKADAFMRTFGFVGDVPLAQNASLAVLLLEKVDNVGIVSPF